MFVPKRIGIVDAGKFCRQARNLKKQVGIIGSGDPAQSNPGPSPPFLVALTHQRPGHAVSAVSHERRIGVAASGVTATVANYTEACGIEGK
jgi:hypothetical protein